MRFQKKLSRRVLSLAAALVTGISSVGIGSLSGGVLLASAEEDTSTHEHSYDTGNTNGFCDVEGCTEPYQPAEDSDGDGTYEIANAGQLYWFAEQVVNGEVSLNAIFTADIVVNEGDVAGCNGTKDASWRDWTPIGDGYYGYKGTFDGQGHTISGLYFYGECNPDEDQFDGEDVGIVRKLNDSGVIQNVGLENSYFYGETEVAGICGRNSGGIIRNCYNTATITCENIIVGGIVGYSYGTVRACVHKRFKSVTA